MEQHKTRILPWRISKKLLSNFRCFLLCMFNKLDTPRLWGYGSHCASQLSLAGRVSWIYGGFRDGKAPLNGEYEKLFVLGWFYVGTLARKKDGDRSCLQWNGQAMELFSRHEIDIWNCWILGCLAVSGSHLSLSYLALLNSSRSFINPRVTLSVIQRMLPLDPFLWRLLDGVKWCNPIQINCFLIFPRVSVFVIWIFRCLIFWLET